MHKKYVSISSSLEKETKGREFRPLVPTVFARGRQGTVQLKQCAFGEGETDFTRSFHSGQKQSENDYFSGFKMLQTIGMQS